MSNTSSVSYREAPKREFFCKRGLPKYLKEHKAVGNEDLACTKKDDKLKLLRHKGRY